MSNIKDKVKGAKQQSTGKAGPATTALQKAEKAGTLKGLNTGDIGNVLNAYKGQLEKVIPKHLTADRMIQMATTLIARNPKIAECTATSVVGAVVQASILGFPPVADLGYCYFVPYNRNIGTKKSPRWEKELQFQMGYKGHMELARRSDQVSSIHAEVVRVGDNFKYRLGLHPELDHIPQGEVDGEITHAYAVAHYKDGGYNFVVLTKGQIESLRMRSPGQKETPSDIWKTDYPAMAMAKAIKQLSKFLPKTIDYQQNLVTDEKVIHLDDIEGGKVKIENLDQQDLTDLNNVEEAEEVNEEVDKSTGEVKQSVDKEQSPEVKEEKAEKKDGKLSIKDTYLKLYPADEGGELPEEPEMLLQIEARTELLGTYGKLAPGTQLDLGNPNVTNDWLRGEIRRLENQTPQNN